MEAWPLIGRRTELSLLTAAVVARRGAVIAGQAGVGKTTLAMECVRLAQERGISLARATDLRLAKPALWRVGVVAAARLDGQRSLA